MLKRNKVLLLIVGLVTFILVLLYVYGSYFPHQSSIILKNSSSIIIENFTYTLLLPKASTSNSRGRAIVGNITIPYNGYILINAHSNPPNSKLFFPSGGCSSCHVSGIVIWNWNVFPALTSISMGTYTINASNPFPMPVSVTVPIQYVGFKNINSIGISYNYSATLPPDVPNITNGRYPINPYFQISIPYPGYVIMNATFLNYNNNATYLSNESYIKGKKPSVWIQASNLNFTCHDNCGGGTFVSLSKSKTSVSTRFDVLRGNLTITATPFFNNTVRVGLKITYFRYST